MESDLGTSPSRLHVRRFASAEDIFAFAISLERQAHDFYQDLALDASARDLRDLLLGLAAEEAAHAERLEAAKHLKLRLEPARERVETLGLAELVPPVKRSGPLSLEAALRVAMRDERSARKLYVALAEEAEDPRLRRMLVALAEEEERHTLKLELAYDELLFRGGGGCAAP